MNKSCIIKNFNLFKSCAIALLVIGLSACEQNNDTTQISLAGQWNVVLDSSDIGEQEGWNKGIAKDLVITLPGTLDLAKLGKENTLEPGINNYVLSHLARKHQYIGKAWYQKEVYVPKNWKGQQCLLNLERIIWESAVWINGNKVGTDNSLVSPHKYEVGEYLKSGKNKIVVCIDNSSIHPGINVPGNKYPEPTSKDMAHAYTNHTQIKWNGIIGDISLQKLDPLRLSNIQIYPEYSNKKLIVKSDVSGDGKSELQINYQIFDNAKSMLSGTVDLTPTNGTVTFELELNDEFEAWDEFNPKLYTLKTKVVGGDGEQKTVFGIRDLKSEGSVLTLNGKRIYLRGTLECAVFPYHGFPYTDKASWLKIMKVAKDYGLNHFRFHSWCPPKAAFEAADELGFYLQTELPHWSLKVGKDPNTIAFLEEESDRLLQEYGNHPSFLLMALGNELQGDVKWMNSHIKELKEIDTRHLYTTTTFSFQKGVGKEPQPEDEFFVTQYTNKGWIRGQGIFNAKPPHFNKDYRNEIDHIEVPIISHEIGQYSVYPDLREIEKYTGTLTPLNFIAVKNALKEKGMLHLAENFTQASGKLAALLYKEEIERALKTPEFDGFQLLQLQDFPGQGTALVGLLNVFWDSKGIIDDKEFSSFSGPVVPLIDFEKAVYSSGEKFDAAIRIANFQAPIDNANIKWSIKDGLKTYDSGIIEGSKINHGNFDTLGFIRSKLDVEQATKLTVKLAIEGTNFKNEWPIWVYPKAKISKKDIVYTRSFQEAMEHLEKGKKVLLNPEISELNGVKGRFVPVFWSPVHFPDQPATMGILCDPTHPALSKFPTDTHTNWQWWDLCINSSSVILDSLNIEPIVRVVDNFVTNRNLGNIFEAKIGEGRLLFTSIDLKTDINNRLVAKQLKMSLVDYMNTEQFSPKKELEIEKLLTIKTPEKE